MLANFGRLVSGLLLGGIWLSVSPANAESNVLFIFDASGSMKTAVGSDTRISIAKKAMEGALKEMPSTVRLGLLMYGHRRANDCADIELVSPIGADDASTIARTIQSVQPRGETPIATALRQAARSFQAFKGQNNSIVLITDGIEECKGDPCAAANEIKAAGLDLKVHIVGFTLNDAQRKAIQCIADVTGGKYFDAKDASGLNSALNQVRQQTAQAPSPPPAAAPASATPAAAPPSRINLIAKSSGGEMVFGSGPDWALLNDDALSYHYGFAANDEGVYGFRNGQSAKFDTFAVFIPSADSQNAKELEVFAGDEGPTGAFRSLGVVTVANGKLRDGWQEFKLPETTAKFLKVRLLSNHGGNGYYLYELRLMGELVQASNDSQAAATSRASTNRRDLMPRAEVLLASGNDWKLLNDGSFGYHYGFAVGDEGVYAFEGGKAATFDTIGVYIPSQSSQHPKELEIFAGDEGPTGAFRSLGVITVLNGKMRDGWQDFKLPETTAKLLKVKILSNYGGNGLYLYELRLMGELK